MHKSPQTTQLSNKFKQLDQEKKGFITQEQFSKFIDKQPQKLPYYIVSDIFNALPNQQMNEQAFIILVMGYRMNMQQFVLTRFLVEKQLLKHASASPLSGANQVRNNSLKLFVASHKHLQGGEKNKLSVNFGYDNPEQTKRFQQFQEILGRKPSQIVGLIKFRVDGAHEQIRSGIEGVIETARGILLQMDQQMSRKIDLLKFTVKAHGNYIYIFIQMPHVFFEDMATFINEAVKSINSNATLRFSALIQSNYLKYFLKEGEQTKMEDLQVQLKFDVDSQTQNKLKQVAGSGIQNYSNQQVKKLILLFLFQQINIQGSFTNSQKLFENFGVGQILTSSKSQLNAVKQLNIMQNLQAFVPDSKQLINSIKKHGKGNGEISINIQNVYLKLQFNLSIEGLLDLL